jgi:hypothetical protein
MRVPTPIQAYVSVTVGLAAVTMFFGWLPLGPAPLTVLLIGIISFVVVGVMIEMAAINFRGGDVQGHVAFVVDLACGLLFGPFWGGATAAGASLIAQGVQSKPLIKVVFNAAQRALSVSSAMLVYMALGGAIRPAALIPGSAAPIMEMLGLLPAFLVGAFIYFTVNSLAVAGAIAIS